MKIISLLILFSYVLTPLDSFSAPIPSTSTSDFIKSGVGLFRSPKGFQISAEKTNWIHDSPPIDQNNIATLYKAPTAFQGVQSLLSVRVDELKNPKTLNQYMREWVKVYPRLGFNILSTKRVTVNQKEGFLLDLLHPKSLRQVRQVVFLKDKNAVVMSCRGHKDEFKVTVKSCNQIIRNFSWL